MKTLFLSDVFNSKKKITIGFLLFIINFSALAQRCVQSVTASGTQTLCQNAAASALTSGIASGGSGMPVSPSYQWFSNSVNNNTTGTPIASATSSSYVPPTNTFGTVYYYVRVINGNGAGSCSGGSNISNTVAVTVNQAPTPSAAGPDQAFCNSTTANLAGNTPSVGGGVWTLISGSGTVTTPTSPTSGITGLGIGANTFRWTISVGSCTSSDDVVITRNALPNANAGPDKVLTCTATAVTLSGSSSTGGATFSWTTLGGNFVSGAGTATPSVNAAGTYVLTVTSTAGCISRDTAQVTVNTTVPNASAGADKTLNCVVTSVQLNGSSSTSGVSYNWTSATGNFVSGKTTATPTVNAAGTYILTVTNPVNGCTAKDTAIVNLNNSPPNASAGNDKTLNCVTTAVILNGSSTTGGAGYLWTTSGGNITAGGATATPTVNAQGSYILTVTDPVNGCSAKDTVSVNLNLTAPDVNASVDSMINCYHTSVYLTGSSSTEHTAFNWSSISGNIVSGSATSMPEVNAAGNYYLTVTDSINGCTASDTVMVIANLVAPDVEAGNDTTLTCTVTQISLTGVSSTRGAIYQWVATNGGVIYSGSNSPNPVVQIPGTYVLTVKNPLNGCTAQDSVNVYQNVTAPDAQAGSGKILNCIVASVNLSGSTTTSNSIYSWITLDGNIVSGSNSLTPLVDQPGTYMLTVTDTLNGCQSMDITDVVLNLTSPDVNAGRDSTLTCSVTSLVLNGMSATPSSTFLWNTTNGNISAGTSTSFPTIDASGAYVLTVTDTVNGCTSSDTVQIFLNNTLPDVNANVDSVINCYHTSVMLAGSSTTLQTSFSWTTNLGNIVSGGNTTNPTVDLAGDYFLSVIDSINGCSASDTVTVMSNMALPDVSAGNDTTLTCTLTSATLNGTSSVPNAIFTWTASNGGIIFSGANTANPVVQIPGTYILTVKNPVNGCSAQDSANVYQNIVSPDVDAGASMVLNCSVTSLMLSGSSTTSNTIYSWTTLDGNIVSGNASLSPLIDEPGTYFLTVTDTINGCQSSDITEVNLNNTIPQVNAGADFNLTCIVDAVMLNGSSSTSDVSFSWTTLNGNILLGPETATPSVNAVGEYVLIVTDTINGCSSSDTASVYLNNILPNVMVSSDTIINCTNPILTISGTSSTANTSFSWTTIDGNIISGSDSLNATVTLGGTYVFTVTDMVNGCSSSDSLLITLDNDPPVVEAGIDSILNCTVTQITLNGIAAVSGVNYLWSTINGNIVSGNTSLNPVISAEGDYVLTVTNPVNGCTALDSLHISSNTNSPVADGGQDATLNCQVTLLPLLGTASTQNAIMYWTNSADDTIASGIFVLISTPDSYIFNVIDPVNGCRASDTVNVIADTALPMAFAGLDTVIGCGIDSVMLQGNASGIMIWNTNNGNILTATDSLDIYVNATGTYVLTVTNPLNGCSASDSVVVNSNVPPIVDLGNDTTMVFCQGQITLDAGNPGLSYLWSTSESTQSINITGTGNYYVTVTNEFGCSVTDTINITVNPAIISVDLGTDTTVALCQGSIILDAMNQGLNYLWSTNETSQTINVSSTGVYHVTVTDNTGCTGSDTISVIVIPGILTVDIGNDTSFMNCQAPPFILDAGNQGATYLWSNGTTGQTLNVTTSGTYYVMVTDQGGCVGSDTINVNIINNNINVNLGRDTTVCQCVLLNAGYPGATYYSWSNGQNYAIINACSTGDYWVTVSNGTCMDRDTVHVTFASPPVVDLGPDTTLTAVTSFVIDAGHPGANYLWSTGETTQSITVTTSGQYFVIVTEGLGCSSKDTINVNLPISIQELSSLDLNVNISPNPSSNKSFTLSFNLVEDSDVEINVMNILGKIVYSEKLVNFNGIYRKKIMLDNVSSGIYFTNVITERQRKTTKVIIE
ncbi:MAG: hypothetical protein K0Q95_2291 [Bacteroidota bacterium]|jgi:hypothetical protein|nr:hypothetical protein [Bacteroidota bacterium]